MKGDKRMVNDKDVVWNLVSGEVKEITMPNEAHFGEEEQWFSQDEIRTKMRSIAKAIAGWPDMPDDKIAWYLSDGNGEVESTRDSREKFTGKRIRFVNIKIEGDVWLDSGNVTHFHPKPENLPLEELQDFWVTIKGLVNWSDIPDEDIIIILPDGVELLKDEFLK